MSDTECSDTLVQESVLEHTEIFRQIMANITKKAKRKSEKKNKRGGGAINKILQTQKRAKSCLLYTSPSPRD